MGLGIGALGFGRNLLNLTSSQNPLKTALTGVKTLTGGLSLANAAAAKFGVETAAGTAGFLSSGLSSFLSAVGGFLGVAGVIAAPILASMEPDQATEEVKALGNTFAKSLTPIFSQVGLNPSTISKTTDEGTDLAIPQELQQFSGAGIVIGSMLPSSVSRRGNLMKQIVNDSLVKSGANAGQALQVYRSLLPRTFDQAMSEFQQRADQGTLQFGTNLHPGNAADPLGETAAIHAERFEEGANALVNIFEATGELTSQQANDARAQIQASASNVSAGVVERDTTNTERQEREDFLENLGRLTEAEQESLQGLDHTAIMARLREIKERHDDDD